VSPARSRPGDDGPLARWGRRALTIPAFALAFAVAWAASPLLLPAALGLDLLRRRRLAATRAAATVLVYLLFEMLGLAALLGLWASGGARGDRARLFRFERWWARSLLRALLRIFGMRLEVEGLEAVPPGPILVFGNHASLADPLLAAALVEHRCDLRLRYVGKRELVWDPCIDLGGHLLRYVFVRRGASDTPGDVARVQGLLAGLGPSDGVFMMPEGTRITEGKRRRVLAGEEGAERAQQARRLERLLPPRLGGILGLFERNPGADVVIMAHVGFEGVRGLADVWNGALIGRTIRVAFWRRRWSEVPADTAGRVAWIHREWEALDAWLSGALGARHSG
jgi:1-acyl-sn-glycerol-3-phosphate acyltransferase